MPCGVVLHRLLAWTRSKSSSSSTVLSQWKPLIWTKWQASPQQQVATADSTMVALPLSAPSCNGRTHTRPSLHDAAGLRPAVRREHDADACPTNALCRPIPPGVADPWEQRRPRGSTVRPHRRRVWWGPRHPGDEVTATTSTPTANEVRSRTAQKRRPRGTDGEARPRRIFHGSRWPTSHRRTLFGAFSGQGSRTGSLVWQQTNTRQFIGPSIRESEPQHCLILFGALASLPRVGPMQVLMSVSARIEKLTETADYTHVSDCRTQ